MKPATEQSHQIINLVEKSLQRKVIALQSLLEGVTKPVMLFIAGPNGSGKSTLFRLYVNSSDRPFCWINSDELAKALIGVPDADRLAANFANVFRLHMLQKNVDFALETVFSDEKEDKLAYIDKAHEAGFYTAFVYVCLQSHHLSKARKDHRVANGGHNVDDGKLLRRWLISRENARKAFARKTVDLGILLDNSSFDPEKGLKRLAITHNGVLDYSKPGMPAYASYMLEETGPLVISTNATQVYPLLPAQRLQVSPGGADAA